MENWRTVEKEVGSDSSEMEPVSVVSLSRSRPAKHKTRPPASFLTFIRALALAVSDMLTALYLSAVGCDNAMVEESTTGRRMCTCKIPEGKVSDVACSASRSWVVVRQDSDPSASSWQVEPRKRHLHQKVERKFVLSEAQERNLVLRRRRSEIMLM